MNVPVLNVRVHLALAASFLGGCLPADFPANPPDNDNDGVTVGDGDCDDDDPNLTPDTIWYADTDGDGIGDDDASLVQCDAPEGYVLVGGDCDDADQAVGASLTWYTDLDEDGYGDAGKMIEACDAPAGHVADNTDCDDDEPLAFPGNTEVCDDIDNDCAGGVDDDATDAKTFFADTDGDSYGDPGAPTEACDAPAEHVEDNTDCDDEEPLRHPGATEYCDDPLDYDCDDQTTLYADADTDGSADCLDCDDTNADRFPGNTEVCDGVDNNCNDVVDGTQAVDQKTWFLDSDGDGYGDVDIASIDACNAPTENHVELGGDCDDNDVAFNPGAKTETCSDPNDYDCDGEVLYADTDKDGSADCDDCAPTDDTKFPGNDEVCNGQDDNCDSVTDDDAIDRTKWYLDTDGDLYGATDTEELACDAPSPDHVDKKGDCNEADPAQNPGATEDCTKDVDLNCDGSKGFADADSDGTPACEDCNDNEADAFPGNTETCADTIDNDCDLEINEDDAVDASTWYFDGDNDDYGIAGSTTVACEEPTGYAAVAGDCKDAVASVNPGEDEVCDVANENEDCDSGADNADPQGAVDAKLYYSDDDNDGHGDKTEAGALYCDPPSTVVLDKTDCNDGNADISPSDLEICDDGVNEDEDCDGFADDLDSAADGKTNWYLDNDGDSFGSDAASAVVQCDAPPKHVANNADCDDASNLDFPSATEVVGNEDDDDCNGKEVCYVDADDDGFGNAAGTTKEANGTTCGTELATTKNDCNESCATIFPGATELVGDSVDQNCDTTEVCYVDVDNDGFRPGAGTSTVLSTANTVCTDDGEGLAAEGTGDCHDTCGSIKPGATELAGDNVDQNCNAQEICYVDADDDGFRPGAGTATVQSTTNTVCTDTGEGLAADGTGDCSDVCSSVRPNAAEITGDSVDQNCDTVEVCFVDADNDNFRPGTGTATVSSTLNTVCTDNGEALATDGTSDCSDGSSAVRPGVSEVAGDAFDQNCDGAEVCYLDNDGDGVRPDATSTLASTDVDCSDTREALSSAGISDCSDGCSSVRPGATEVAGDNLDQNCDTFEICFIDSDNDGYRSGAGTATLTSTGNSVCTDAGEAVATDPTGDCSDSSSAVNPGATFDTVGDSVDQNCDAVEVCFVDADNDGYRHNTNTVSSTTNTVCADGTEALATDPAGDCADTSAGIHPGVTVETIGDGIDINCDNAEVCYLDADNDGHLVASPSTVASTTNTTCADAKEGTSGDAKDDCDDTNAARYTGNTEICDTFDNDCDTFVDEGFAALSFDGTDDYVVFADLPDMNGAVTFEAWIDGAPGTTGETLISTQCFEIGWANENVAGYVFPSCDGGAASAVEFDLQTGAVPAGYFHIAVVFDDIDTPTSMRLFINGTSLGIDTLAPAITPPARTMSTIGYRPDTGSGESFVQAIYDQLRVSSSARYTTGFVPATTLVVDASTVLLYGFDEGTGASLDDESVNDRTGTLQWDVVNGTPPTWLTADGAECP